MHRGKETLVAVVADDLLIESDSSSESKRVVRKLREAGLDTKDLGHPEYVIGMHVKRHRNGDISLNQKLQIETLLRRFEMQDAHDTDTCATPADPNVKLSKDLEANTPEKKRHECRQDHIVRW